MLGWQERVVWGMVALAWIALPVAAAGADANAAVMTLLMPGVGKGEMAKRTDTLWEALSQYHQLLPRERVQEAENRARSSGCNEDECLGQVRQALGVEAVYSLYYKDEGYNDFLHMTRASADGIVKQKILCSRCTIRQYRRTLDKLLHVIHTK